MPTQLFYTTQIPVSLWFINKQKKQSGKTLFIDARKMGTMVSRKLRELTEDDIQKIADTYTTFVDGTLDDVKGYCAVADTFRRAYCKRLALRNRFQLTEAEFDDDLFVFGQFHTLDEADQKLLAGVDRIQKLLHQLSCSVFCADRAFFL